MVKETEGVMQTTRVTEEVRGESGLVASLACMVFGNEAQGMQ